VFSELKKQSTFQSPDSVQRKSGQSSAQVFEDNRESNAIQRKPNRTGLPDNLKSGMESLSGKSLDHVKVHYNSSKPAAVQAHAYAQGSDIHLASGQEKHLPHELGHVVQQMEGRVKPTTSVGGMAVNDNPSLENEATEMGNRALKKKGIELTPKTTPETTDSQFIIPLAQRKQESMDSCNSKSPTKIMQLAMPQVNRLLNRYIEITGDSSPAKQGSYSRWSQLENLNDGTTFTSGQFNKLKMAMNDFDSMGNRTKFKDRSGGSVVAANEIDPNIPSERINQIYDGVKSGPNASGPHYEVLKLLKLRILKNLGNNTLIQFWKGAHIVFKDNGSVYKQLLQKGGAIAARKEDGSIKTKTEFAGMTSTNYFGFGSSTHEQRRGSMMARRPGAEFKETSHYPETVGGPPQYGIDMPEAIGGHLLFGLTPDGDTFVQTEGAGFQNFDQGFTQHLKGFATVKGAMQAPVPTLKYTGGWFPSVPRPGLTWKGSPKGTQTGIAGYSSHSEAEGVHSEIREHDNGNFDDFLAKIV